DMIRLEPIDKVDERRVASATADDRDDEVVQVAEKRRRPDESIEILCMTDVAGMHDDERFREIVLSRPLVVLRRGRDCGSVDPVGNDGDALRKCTLLHESPTHRVPDGNDAVRAAQVETDECPQHLNDDLALEPLELDSDL